MNLNFIKTVCFLIISLFFLSCGGNHSKEHADGFVLKKENDWAKMNLKGQVKEIRESGEGSNKYRNTSYIKFNEKGYITEKGFLNENFGNNGLKEAMKYDSSGENRIEHIVYDDLYNYDVFKYDSIGNLIEKQKFKKNYQRQIAQLEQIEKYRYETIERRNVNVYCNDVLFANIEYDKYKNEILKEAYNSDGSLSRRYKNEYTYDDKGNVLTKKEYYASLPPFTMEEPIELEYNSTYDDRGNLIEQVRTKYLDIVSDKEKNKNITTRKYDTSQKWDYDANDNIVYDGTNNYSYKYDFMGNWMLQINSWTYVPLLSREYQYYYTDFQKTEMSINIEELQLCGTATYTLFINGGTPFDNPDTPFQIKCHHKESNTEAEIYLENFVKKAEGRYEVRVTQDGNTDEEYIFEVVDAKGNKKTVSFMSIYCA